MMPRHQTEPKRRLLHVGPAGAEPWWEDLVPAGRLARIDLPPNSPLPLSVPDESFDAMAIGVPHDALSAALLSEVQRVLKPGGMLLARAVRERATRRALSPYFHLEVERRDASGVVIARSRSARQAVSHFDELAPEYEGEIPVHLRDVYLRRKVEVLDRVLPPAREGLLGLDLGCGLGWYAEAVASRYGARVVAADASRPTVQRARDRGNPAVSYLAADGCRLPFAGDSFDFAYAINVLHHFKRGEQERVLREVHRVLKPGAPLVVFEINLRNPVFRWYMRHVFPRTRRIDKGDEEFIHPDRLPLVDRFNLESIEYSTFLPDFLPRWSLPAAMAAEGVLLRSPLRRHAIHYAAVLRASRR